MNNKLKKLSVAIALFGGLNGVWTSQAQTVLPASYAMPSGSVDTTRPGFRVRPYMTDASHGGTLAWSEDQLAGLHGPNTADLTGADADGYLYLSTVVNWNISPGNQTHDLQPTDAMPGIGSGSTENFTEEVIAYIQFPAAGTYTMGVNSDDGFGVSAAALNPKDRFMATQVGSYDGTRGLGDTLFSITVSKAGIYPFRLVYFQGGGGGGVTWFSVVTNSTSTTFFLINDTTTSDGLAAYAYAKIAPPYVGGLVYSPAGFSFTINDDLSALASSSLQVKLNGTNIAVSTSKSGTVTTVSYVAPSLIAGGTTNAVSVQFQDNATPANTGSASFTFVEPTYVGLPASVAVPRSSIDTTQRGFHYRVSQFDSQAYGIMAANVAHAEAQLAGLLIDPSAGTAYPNISDPGTQSDGSYIVSDVLNFAYDLSTSEGSFTGDVAFPGINGVDSANIAGEVVTYLDLQAGYYNFAVKATDGFRVTASANPYDAFATPLGLYDYRSSTMETPFGVAVQTAGIYPIRLVFYRMGKGADNKGDASLEFYTINTDGTKSLVNDTTDSKSVKAYWKSTATNGTYVKYAGPSAFVSPFVDSSDVGFDTLNVQISKGSSTTVDSTSVTLSVDGKSLPVQVSSANGITTLTHAYTDCQLPRIVHSATLVYKDAGTGAAHTNQWNFHLLRNYVFPAPLYFEDFESTDAGPEPTVPTGWVQENYTGSEHAGNDPSDLNSDFYLGWVVVDSSWGIGKDLGLSAFTPQVFNGVAFNADSNPLLVNHYIRAESDARQNGPPGQIQYLTTKSFDCTGKTGIVIAFNSSYEQNQDSLVALECSIDGGTTYSPVFYWVQGNGVDSQGVSDLFHDSLGNVDVNKTLLTTYSDVARYTNAATSQLVGGYYGFFIKAPITDALAPYIEGRYNDDSSESKRIEAYRVPVADNQKDVRFRFVQAGTSSWYWAIDNLGIYSVPSLVISTPVTSPTLKLSRSSNTLTFNWASSASFQLQKATNLLSPQWVNVGSATTLGTATDTVDGSQAFFRLINQ